MRDLLAIWKDESNGLVRSGGSVYDTIFGMGLWIRGRSENCFEVENRRVNVQVARNVGEINSRE